MRTRPTKLPARALVFGFAVSMVSVSVCVQAQQVADPSEKGTQANQGGGAELQEIIVTAQKREEREIDVPIAIQALSGDNLSNSGFTDLRDLTTSIPSFRADNPGNPASVAYAIRGVGQRDVNPIGEGAVATYIDGTYVSFLNTVGQPLYDIDHVEVLKGPQGTLFGRNATGGLVNIIFKQPTEQPEGYVTIEGSSDNGRRIEAAVGGPIAEKVTARLSGSYDSANGWLENTTGPNLLAKDNLSARLQVKFQPSDDFSLLLSARVWDAQRVPGVGLSPKPYVVNSAGAVVNPPSAAAYAAYCASIGLQNPPAGAWQGGSCLASQSDPLRGTYGTSTFYNENYYATTATVEWKLSDAATLTSISDYQHVTMDYSANITATTAPYFQYDIFTQPQEQYSEELRLNGRVGGLSWQTGLFYLHTAQNVTTDVNLTNLIGLDFLAKYSQNAGSTALFGQADYDLTDRLTLTVGGRGNYDSKTLNNLPDPALSFLGPLLATTGLTETRDETLWSGRGVLTYKPAKDSIVYLGVNRGTKAGGFNSGGAETYLPSDAYFKPETLVSYEAGAKSSLLDNHLQVEGAVFHYDYTDYQAFAQPPGSGLRTINVNAKVNGAELFVTAVPVRGLSLSAGVTYLDAYQINVPLPSGGTQDFPMPDAPRWTADAQIRYGLPILGDDELAFQVNGTYSTWRTISAIEYADENIPGYRRYDAHVSYDFPGRRYSITAFVNNLTNAYIIENRVDFTSLSGNAVDTPERPRWFGVNLTYRY